uniref:Uncharacterized protein n=1 Tax=Strombidium cf. sulcatum TaxID=2793073 RepID=A0A7T0M4M0_9SPIT|nr:hypothetical protein J6674_mgp08 [Strombidium cf. sulcatum]QPL15936.1 hypothetical protein [Strombidium cf. sulcatum]
MMKPNLNLWIKNITNFVDLKLPTINFNKKSELIWLDSYLFDYLQKKTTDLWVRRFLIFSGFLFSEHYIYSFLIRIYTINFTNLISNKLPFENFNVIENILNIFFFFLLLILLFFFILVFFTI